MKLKILILASIATCIAIYLTFNQTVPSMQRVAITQIVDHPSLNQARKGLLKALSEAGYVEGENIRLSYETPNGNLSIAAQIANKYNHQKPDVVVAISSASAQSVLAANTNHNPIVFSSVTDPLSAKLLTHLANPEGDITGTMEIPPVKALLNLITQWLPQTKTIGIIYNLSEINSVKTVELIKTSTYLKIVEAPVSNTIDIQQAIQSLISKVDVLILPSDNTVWAALEMLSMEAKKHHVPIFTNDPDSVYKGATLALGFSQYAVGYDAGKKVVKILKGEKLKNIPVTVPEKSVLYINAESIQAMGLKIPEEILHQADRIIKAGE